MTFVENEEPKAREERKAEETEARGAPYTRAWETELRKLDEKKPGGLLNLAGKVTGIFSSLEEFQQTWPSAPEDYIKVGGTFITTHLCNKYKRLLLSRVEDGLK
jgi:hypothetical protein